MIKEAKRMIKMIWDKQQFVDALEAKKKCVPEKLVGNTGAFVANTSYNQAIDDIIELVEIECNCFKGDKLNNL